MASKVQPFTVTSTPLLANAVFTSIWYDAFGLETIYLSLTSFSDQASAASGVVVQETDDQANANLTNTSLTTSALASTTFKGYATIRRRFFRIVYTNGAVNQTSFEMTMTAFASIPTLVDASGNLITTGAGGAAATQVQGTSADGAAVVGNPVLIAGATSGDLVEPLLTDTDGTTNTNQTKVGGTAYALGQAVAGSSAPVVLPSAQLPNVGQAAMASSVPVAIASNQSAVPVSGTVSTTPPANASTNVAQVGGTNTDTNSGVKSAGTIRVVLATDQPQLTNKLLVTPDSVALPANQSVNVSQVAGTNTSVNNGTTDAGTTRVTLSSDSTGQVKLAAGANTIGAISNLPATVDTGSGNSGASTLRVVPATTTPADATSNTSVPGFQDFNMIWNGATWDRLKGITGQVGLIAVGVVNSGTNAADAFSNGSVFTQLNNAGNSQVTLQANLVYNGTSWDRPRTPNVFRTVSATASGNTAAWTPAGGKKFRLMRLGIDVTGNAATSGGAVIVISFQDSAADINVTFSVFCPAVALAAQGLYTQVVDLGNGFLSAAANNVLNVNLSAALTAGAVRVRMEGTEE